MKSFTIIALFFLSIHCFSQDKESVVGLWLITEVKVGDDIMTPNARWARFNADLTQESGNGRFQHSYGSWAYSERLKELQIETINGLDDRFGAFSVELLGDRMKWKRKEEGMDVIVTLNRTAKLPETYRDRLLGLWKLKKAKNNGDFFEESVNESDYLFIRWDGKFVVGNDSGKTYGVYNVHGHKPQIELIPYTEGERSFWSIEFLVEGFQMTLVDSDPEVIRRFERIRNFPK